MKTEWGTEANPKIVHDTRNFIARYELS